MQETRGLPRRRHLNCCVPLHAHFIAAVGPGFTVTCRICAGTRMRRHGAAATGGRGRAPSTAPATREIPHPGTAHRAGQGLAAWRKAHSRRRPDGHRLRHGPGPSTLAVCIAKRECSRPAKTNAPPKPQDARGLRGWVQKKAMKRAGSITPSANRITLFAGYDRSRRRRSALHVCRRVAFTVWHGSGG